MLKIRKVKTGSGKTAVQVVRYVNRKTNIVKHIGSASSAEKLDALITRAQDFINHNDIQPKLYTPSPKQAFTTIDTKRTYLYKVFASGYHRLFDGINSNLLKNLVIIRIVEPASKRYSLELLDKYFGIRYSLQYVYRQLPKLLDHKQGVEELSVAYAKKSLNFDFTFVLYDVTTLYFETFKGDDLRETGFSKDNKFNQPQILIGLVVTKEGFPVSYEVFSGGTSEGKTIIPSIVHFKDDHAVKNLTVIADAAMISKDNIKALRENELNYVVGARLRGMKSTIIQQISDQLKPTDGNTIRLKTEYGLLVCQYSHKRYKKDLHEHQKYVRKAEENLSKQSNIIGKYKFIKKAGENRYELNQALIDKAERLLGIKGYITNQKDWSDTEVIKKYSQLWQVEKSFRMAKSDLATRPIFHRRSESIKAHILMCFMALCVGRKLELESGRSIKQIVTLLGDVVDTKIRVEKTGEIIEAPGELSKEVKELISSLDLSH